MRLLLAVVVGYAAFAAAYLPAYRWMYMAEAACDQPCRDFGHEEVARVEGALIPRIYKPKCEPLSLKLELREPKIRASWKAPLWYRLTMKNTSCRGLGSFDGDAFLEGMPSSPPAGYDVVRDTDGYRGGFWMESDIKDAGWDERNGAEVKKTPIERIIPYIGDFDAYKRMKREFGMDEYVKFDLRPGQQVQTASPKLLPRRYLPGLEHAFKTGNPTVMETARKSLYPENPGYQTPPAGGYLNYFMLLPGRGRFRVVYQNGALHAYPIPRFTYAQLRWASYPLLPLRAVEFLFDVDFMPSWSGRPFYFRVTAASNWVEFEATP